MKKVFCVGIIGLLSAACFVGCGKGGEKVSLNMFGEKTTEATTATGNVQVSTNGVSIDGDLNGAIAVDVRQIEDKESVYQKVKTQINEENLVTMELYYINLLDETGEKVQQNGASNFTITLSSEIKKAGGDTFGLYYYNASEGKLDKIDFDRYGDIIQFSTDKIGLFAIVNINNSGEPITKAPKEEETKPAKETEGPETKAPETKAPETVAPTTEIFTTVPPFEEITTYHAEPTKATEAPTTEKAAETPTPAGSGNKETPNLEFRLSAKNDGNCLITFVNITNLGNYTVRVMPENATFEDAVFPEHNRTLRLTDYDYNVLPYQDIQPGESVKVYFSVVGGVSWYNNDSTYINFDISYDGAAYRCKTIYNGKVSVTKK